ncbi:MAG: PilN domain-containing protein [Gemmatimonadetes bacterium]|nr:PilN domain-containing protein [Gemmatimonadota bacterium]
MIEINLLPGGDKRRPTRQSAAPASSRRALKVPGFGADPWMVGLGAAAVLLLLAAAGIWWSTASATTRLESQIAQEVTDSTRYAATIDLVTSLRARQDTIQQKIEVIRSVDTRRYVWPRVLDEISRSVPAFTWLGKMESAEGDGGPTLTLEGSAGSTQALTRFMKNLEASPFIRDVTLVTTEQVEAEGRTLNRFTLEARYEAPDSTFIETIPVVVVSN